LPPAWFVYISQLIQNAEVCSKYDQFLYARWKRDVLCYALILNIREQMKSQSFFMK
jgi:hypothetical protein